VAGSVGIAAPMPPEYPPVRARTAQQSISMSRLTEYPPVRARTVTFLFALAGRGRAARSCLPASGRAGLSGGIAFHVQPAAAGRASKRSDRQ